MAASDLLFWQENGTWIVAHPDIDLVHQGSTLSKAVQRYYQTLAVMTLDLVTSGGIAQFRSPPPNVKARWFAMAKAHQQKQPPS